MRTDPRKNRSVRWRRLTTPQQRQRLPSGQAHQLCRRLVHAGIAGPCLDCTLVFIRFPARLLRDGLEHAGRGPRCVSDFFLGFQAHRHRTRSELCPRSPSPDQLLCLPLFSCPSSSPPSLRRPRRRQMPRGTDSSGVMSPRSRGQLARGRTPASASGASSMCNDCHHSICEKADRATHGSALPRAIAVRRGRRLLPENSSMAATAFNTLGIEQLRLVPWFVLLCFWVCVWSLSVCVSVSSSNGTPGDQGDQVTWGDLG